MLRIIFSAVFILLISCGGGGGGDSSSSSTPTAPNQSFSTAALNPSGEGTVYNLTLEGRDSRGVEYTGSALAAVRAKFAFNGMMVTPYEVQVNYSGGNEVVSIVGTAFLDENGYLIGTFTQPGDVSCTPAYPDKLPSAVKIGDFGTRADLDCSNSRTIESTWRVEDGKNGRINIITTSSTVNLFGRADSVSEVTYTLNSLGSIVSIRIVNSDSLQNYTLTLWSI